MHLLSWDLIILSSLHNVVAVDRAPNAAFGRDQRGKLGLGTLENKANPVGSV